VDTGVTSISVSAWMLTVKTLSTWVVS
jgi:hypothetical protein